MTTSGANGFAAFRRELRRVAPSLRRDLPWIGDERPWAVLVSEVMLQQTQSARVIEPWRAFLERFPTPDACAAAPLADVLVAWRGLGYHRRAKALHDAALVIARDFDGQVPSTVDQLRTLPGVGAYTAHAVASFAFGAPVAVLDTNVGRVLARALHNQNLRPREAQASAQALLARGESGPFNQTMIDLGAQFCRAVPRCDDCPMARHCAWRREGGADPAPRSAAVSRPQGRFEGSNRQLRGRILAALREGTRSDLELARVMVDVAAPRRGTVIDALVSDGLVTRVRGGYALAVG